MSVPVPYGMACKELVELITDYLEGKLAVAERTRFEMHLCLCDGCRAYLQQIRQVVRTAGGLTEETLPEGSREVLLAAFRDWKRNARRKPT